MAWVNAGWHNERWNPPRWFEYAAGPLPSADSAWNHIRWVAPFWSDADWTDTEILAGDAFSEAGTRANVTVAGFEAGFQFSKQGTAATSGVTTYYPGFSADPGGILDNDTGDGPLSYTVLTQPEAGTLTTYAGGAFTWETLGIPIGRYSWTYELFANGLSEGIGTVTMEHGDLFASASIQGYAAQFGTGFTGQGTAATTLVTTFSGGILLTQNSQGTAATSAVTTDAGTIAYGWVQRGESAENTVQGYSGDLANQFTQSGTAATVGAQGFAGTLDVGIFFSSQGTGASADVTGYAGALLTSFFNEQGTGASVGAIGGASNLRLGVNASGTASISTISGLAGFIPSDISERTDIAIMRVETTAEAKMSVETGATARMRA